jgi:factor associated with neutral sphingomyelinase activation
MQFGLGQIVDLAASKSKRRFHLLMTEDREYYFQDYGGYMHVADSDAAHSSASTATPFGAREKLKGRLHVCSKSIVFDPDDSDIPITRLPFRDIASIKPRTANVNGAEIQYFLVHTRQSVEIPSHSGAYVFRKFNLAQSESEYCMSLSYVDTQTVLAFINQLHGLYRLSGSAKALALQELIRAREEAIPFESSAITDIRERVLLPGGRAVLAQQVQPLLLNPGRLQLTDMRLYFQNFNPVSSEVTSKVDVTEMKRMYKRRYIMRDTALEIFIPLKQSGYGSSSSSTSNASSTLSQTSVYFNFATKALRDTVYELIASCDRYSPLATQTLTSMTSAWLSKTISTFEYLLFVNQQAGRSWMDLTQCERNRQVVLCAIPRMIWLLSATVCCFPPSTDPVMPWVLTDFESETLDLNNPEVYRDLSKPIGALNPERLEMLKRRMQDMPVEISHGHPFLYGTHYSSPGYVLYYLARKAPQYMLRLQAGKFDQPDRLFFSIASTWHSVLHAPTDVKELIPEFYADPSSSSSSSASTGPASFLLNTQSLDFGLRQNGQAVDDVALPKWATSANDFLKKMRAALESQYVSDHLHLWIDLIFGCKQRGDEAMKADNTFFYLTYEGAVDLDSISDPLQKRSLSLQIQEYGQTPRQIFFRPHPKRGEEWTREMEEQMKREEQQGGTAGEEENKQQESASAASPDYSIPSMVAQPDFLRLHSSEAGLPVSPSSAGTGSQNQLLGGRAASSSASAGSSHATQSLAFPSMTLDLTSPNNSNSLLPLNQSLSTLAPTPMSPNAGAAAGDLALLSQSAHALSLAAEVSEIQTKQLSFDEAELIRRRGDSLTALPSASVLNGGSTASSSTPAARKSSITSSKPAWSLLSSSGWSKTETLSLHRENITSIAFANTGVERSVVSVSADGHIKLYSLTHSKLIRSAKVSDMTLSSCSVSADGQLVYISSWDNHVYLYNQSFGRIVTSVQAHDDAVACMAVRGDKMATGSWDTTVKIFNITESSISSRPLLELADHEASITSVALDHRTQGNIAVSGSEDGGMILWDLRARDGSGRQLEGFDAAIKCVEFSPVSADFLVTSEDGILRHVDAGTGKTLFQVSTNETLQSVRTDGYSALAVGESGVVRGWNLRGAEEIYRIETGCGPAVAMAVNEDGTMLATANTKTNVFQLKK